MHSSCLFCAVPLFFCLSCKRPLPCYWYCQTVFLQQCTRKTRTYTQMQRWPLSSLGCTGQETPGQKQPEKTGRMRWTRTKPQLRHFDLKAFFFSRRHPTASYITAVPKQSKVMHVRHSLWSILFLENKRALVRIGSQGFYMKHDLIDLY